MTKSSDMVAPDRDRQTMSSITGAARLGLVDPGTASPAVSKAFARLPVINVFRAMANAESLYRVFKSRAKQYFSDRALTEMLFVIGTYMFIARVIRTGRVPLDEKPAPSPQQGALKERPTNESYAR